MQLTIINGPNLNLLGKREPQFYGNLSFEDFLEKLKTRFPGITFDYFQSNDEGAIVSRLQESGSSKGIILNAAAYSHTSIAIADAVAASDCPVIEVHISNIYAREPFRHHSYLSPHCLGTITGLGLEGYALAVQYFRDARSIK
jgi:3-dehydroquinate dehydratase-2